MNVDFYNQFCLWSLNNRAELEEIWNELSAEIKDYFEIKDSFWLEIYFNL